MKPFVDICKFALDHPVLGSPDPESGGCFRIKTPTGTMNVIASWAMGWDHVSVSRPNRTPTWDEMDFVKRQFFYPAEVVFQLHPAETDHVNYHPHCLHMWRHQQVDPPLPPSILVGPQI